jgi:hypothetical protein
MGSTQGNTNTQTALVNPASPQTNREDNDTIHYLGMALIVVSLILLFCWMCKPSKQNYYVPRPHHRGDQNFISRQKTPHNNTEKVTRPHTVLKDDVVKNTARSTVRSKWASTSSTTDSSRQGFEITPVSAVDPNADALIRASGGLDLNMPPSVPISDGIVTPGLSPSSENRCRSTTESLLSLSDQQIDDGLPYYGYVGPTLYATV